MLRKDDNSDSLWRLEEYAVWAKDTVRELEALGRRRDALTLGFLICGLLAYTFYSSWDKAPNPSWVPVLFTMFIVSAVGALACITKLESVCRKYGALERKIRFRLEHPPCQ